MGDIKIAVGCDHGGLELKNKIVAYLKNKNYFVEDFGTNSVESCDYPLYAGLVCESIQKKYNDYGILVCGTGLGMSICANKYKGIRAVCVSDEFSAKMSKRHNNSNVLTLGQRVLGDLKALNIVDVWLHEDFEGGRHQRRLDMIENIEKTK